MPSGNTGVKYPGSASGWTSSANAGANDAAYATADFLVTNEGGGVFGYDPTAVLNLATFAASVPGGVKGILVEVELHRSGTPSGAAVSVRLTKSGSEIGSTKGGSVGTSDAIVSLGSTTDLWGTTWTPAEIAAMGAHVTVQGTGTSAGVGTASIDFLRVTVYYDQPNAFTFVDVTNQPLSTSVESNAQTIAGLSGSANVVVTSGQWSKNGGAYTSAAGTVVNTDVVKVRHTTSGLFGTTVNTTLDVNGVTDTFSSTTTTSDTTPNAFSFNTRSNANPSQSYDSTNTVSVSGINTSVAISVSGGQYSKNGGAFTSAAGTVNAGDNIVARGTANGTFGGTQVVTVTIGGVAGTFTINTRVADTTPDAYAWTNQSGVVGSSLRTSNAITIAGIEAAATIAFSNKTNATTVAPATNPYEYRINGGAWLNATGSPTITNGQTLELRMGSNASSGVAATLTTSIGGVVRTWTATTTTGDIVPDQFTFVDEPSAAAGEVITSQPVVITGIDASASVSFATGGTATSQQYRKFTSGAWGAWTAVGATTVVNNDQLQLRLTASAVIGDAASITPTISGVSDAWDITAAAADQTPNAFTFVDVAGVDVLAIVTSAPISVSGVNAATDISIAGADAKYRVNGGSWTSAPGSVFNGDTVEVQMTSAGTLSTTISATVAIGTGADIFSVTTRSPNLAAQYVVHFREVPYGADV